MKRSEAIKLMIEEEKKYMNRWKNGESSKADMYSQILEALEDAGMFPPPLVKELYKLNDNGIHFKLTYKFRPDEKKDGDHISNWEAE